MLAASFSYSGSPGLSALRGLYSAGLSSDNFRFSSLILSPPLSVKAASRNETANFFLISWGEKPGLPRPAGLICSRKYLLLDRARCASVLRPAALACPVSLCSLLRRRNYEGLSLYALLAMYKPSLYAIYITQCLLCVSPLCMLCVCVLCLAAVLCII